MCTTSSCESGSRKFSEYAYIGRKVSSVWWYLRWIGSRWKYFSVSFIHPMSHFMSKPRPPMRVERETIGHAVDSSATMRTPGWARWT